MKLTPAERLAAFLIAPQEVARPASEDLPLPEEFHDLVEDHHLPLDEVIAVNQLESDPLVASPAVQAALKKDRERHDAVRGEFAAFRERLDAAGIPHVLVKGVYGVPYRSDNIDIMLAPKDYERAGKLLEEMGYVENLFCPNKHKTLYIRITGSQRSGIFHFHRYVAWYSPFVEPESVFATVVDGAEAGVRLPRTEVSLAIIGCHALYEDACVRLIEMHKIRRLLARGPVDWNFLWEFARQRGFASGLAFYFLVLDRLHRRHVGRPMFGDPELRVMESHLSRLDGTRGHYRRHVAGRDIPSPYKVSKYFARRCLFVQLKRCCLAPGLAKIGIAATILCHGVKQVTRWEPQHGHLVAICGPDGSGKSMMAAGVASGLKCFEISSVRSWRRVGDSPVLNLLKRPLRRNLKAEAEVGQASEQGEFRSRFLRRLWPLLVVPDYVLRLYIAIAWAYLRERLVIADRYHVDALVDLALRCGPEVFEKRWIIWMLRRLPRARPAFMLECSPQTLRRRRHEEYTSGFGDRIIDYYRKAAAVFGAQCASTEADAESVAEKATLEVVRQFFRRL